jgi:predicted membrane-bound mannosyltransferase
VVTGLLPWTVVAGVLSFDFLAAIGVSFTYTGGRGWSTLVSKQKVGATLYAGVRTFCRVLGELPEVQFLTNKERPKSEWLV